MKSTKQKNEALLARLFLEGATCSICANNYICSYAVNPLSICENYLSIKNWRKNEKRDNPYT